MRRIFTQRLLWESNHMCGRFTLRTAPQQIAQLFDVAVPELEPRYNIAPSQPVAAVRAVAGPHRRELVMLHWGLIPFWADDPSIRYKTINARAETAATKPAFRDAFARRRCLILADGFYEWQRVGSKKQPYYFHLDDERPFAFAGLWERWESGGEATESCTILVTEPSEAVAPIHDRMPVILVPDDYDAWLAPQQRDKQKLQSLLRPYTEGDLEAYPVSTLVNSPKNESAKCIEPIPNEPSG